MTKISHQVNSHIPVIDEVKIASSNAIDVPILKTLVQRIQTFTLTDSGLSEQDSPIESKEGSANKNIEDKEGIANTDILPHLLNTSNADASVLVILTLEEQPKLLLTRRAGHLNSHAGEISFAGGKQDLGDGNNVVTALREASEEVGLPTNKVQIVGQLPVQTSKSGMSVRPIVALVEPSIAYVAEVSEIDKIFWADFNTLIKQPTVDYELPYRMDNDNIQLVTPCWVVDGETVWGLTGRIIASLLEICFEQKTPWYYRIKET